MDGATLTVKFVDESPQGQGSPAQTPQTGGITQPYPQVDEQQRAITQAGGVGQQAQQRYSQATITSSASVAQPAVATPASVPVAAPLPTPISTTSQQPTGETALAQSIQSILAHDPRATAEEIAKLLGGGIGAKEVERMMRPTPPPAEPIPLPPTQPSTTPPSTATTTAPATPDDTAMLIRRERRRLAENQDDERIARETKTAAEKQFDDEVEILTKREKRRRDEFAEEDRRLEARQSTTAQQVQATVNAFSHFAQAAGPLGSAVAGTANMAVASPAAAAALGAAAPAIAAAAPYIAIAAASAAIPAAAVTITNNEANRAIAVSRQFSPEVIGAEAQADIRQVFADLRSARRLGDEAGQIVEARSRTSTALQGLRDIVSEPVLRDFANFTSAIAAATETLNKIAQANPAATTVGSRIATDALGQSTFGGFYNIYKAIGYLNQLLGGSDKPSAGFVGIIPVRPKLPRPFSSDSETITPPKLPAGLEGIGPGSFPGSF
jgi:hypothetical protein